MTPRLRALPPTQRAALTVWVLLLLGVAGRVAFSKPGAGSVVPIYLDAATRWVHGDDLYAYRPPLDIFRNPPAIAAAFVPLSVLPHKVAELAWRGLGAAVFLLGLRAWVRHGLPRPLAPGEAGLVFLLAAPLALPSLNNGQANLHLIGLLLLGVAAAARGRGAAAGRWLGAAAAVKLYPLAVGLLVTVAAPRRVLPWLLLTVAALLALPFALQDPAYVADMYRRMAEGARADDRTLAGYGRAPKDLYLVLRVWAGPPDVAAYRAGTLAVAGLMAALVFVAARRARDPRATAPLALHLGCVWMTVLGPATEVHTYTLLAPTAAAGVVLAAADRHRGRLTLAVLGYGLVVSPVVRDAFPNGAPFHALGPQPIGGLLVLAVVVWDAVLRLRTTGDDRVPNDRAGVSATAFHGAR